MARFDTATGRYVYLDLEPCEHRVYFETTGSGIPMLLQHTAGADARQWRHVLEDPALQERFQMIAYDLPYHGKSVPPTDKPWWTQEYRLTRDFLMSVPVGLAAALERIRGKIDYSDIAFELVPPTFTIPELRAVHEVVKGVVYDPGNFRRRFQRMLTDGIIEAAPGKRVTVSKPAKVYCFKRKSPS